MVSTVWKAIRIASYVRRIRKRIRTPEEHALKSTTRHELGHGLSIGWADDKGAPGLPHVAECYSGQDCVGQMGVGGGRDETLERVLLPGQSRPVEVWSIMSRTDQPDAIGRLRFLFSIEELSTVDFEDIPASNG